MNSRSISLTVFAASCGFFAGVLTAPAHSQTCAPPPAGLIGWWPLNETSGTVAADVLGQNAGTASGTIGSAQNSNPKSLPGMVGTGLNFYMQSRVTINTNLNFGTTKSFTVDAWIKSQGDTPIVSNYNSKKFGFTLFQGGSKLRLDMGNGTTVQAQWYGPAIDPNDWTFVAAVVDRTANKVTLYTAKAGDPLASSGPLPITGSPNAGITAPLIIGGCPGNPNGCNSVIDEVEVFNRALTQAELQGIVNAGTAGKCKTTTTTNTKGMTWIHSASNAQNGTITVGCSGCNATAGDTLCTQPRPLLCIYKPTPPFSVPVGLNNTIQNNRWSGGVVATTPPVAGNTFAHSTDATNYCAAQFGPNWRVAEFHDGWGWNFQAYGGTVSAPTVPSTRFWVHINDQPAGNCWKTP